MTVLYKTIVTSVRTKDRPQPERPVTIQLTPEADSRAAADPVLRRAAAMMPGLLLEHLLSLLPPSAQHPARILELGTDPDGGHTAALLAAKYSRDWHLDYAGPDATVISVSHDRRVTEFARQYHADRDRVQFHTARLPDGWPDAAPYDLIICNHAVRELPKPWERQCVQGGHLLMFADVRDRPGQQGFLALQVDHERFGVSTVTFAVEHDGTDHEPWPDITRIPNNPKATVTEAAEQAGG